MSNNNNWLCTSLVLIALHLATSIVTWSTPLFVSQKASQSNELLKLCSVTTNQRKWLKRKKNDTFFRHSFQGSALSMWASRDSVQSSSPASTETQRNRQEVNWAQMHLRVPIGSACCSANNQSRPRFPHEDTEALFTCALILGHSLVHTYLQFYWTSQQIALLTGGGFRFVPSACGGF